MTEVKKAKRLNAEETAKRDRSKMTVLVTKPADSEVEGQNQLLVNRPVECPWCGSLGYADGPEGDYAQCGSCGQFAQL